MHIAAWQIAVVVGVFVLFAAVFVVAVIAITLASQRRKAAASSHAEARQGRPVGVDDSGAAPGVRSIQDRLADVEAARAEGLISEEELMQARRDILGGA